MAFSHGRSKLHTTLMLTECMCWVFPLFHQQTFLMELSDPKWPRRTTPSPLASLRPRLIKKKKKKKKARKFFAACVLCCPEPAFSSCVMSGVLRRLILCVWTSEQELKQDEEVDVFCWHRIARRCMIEQIQGYILTFGSKLDGIYFWKVLNMHFPEP